MRDPRPYAPPSEVKSATGRVEEARPSPTPSSPSMKDPVDHAPGPDELIALARKLQGVRERRKAFLGSDLISETGWEMLIALFQSSTALHRMTVSNICLASHAPTSTALRWLDRLIEMGLVRRDTNPSDARIVFVELEPRGKTAMHAYLCEIWSTLYDGN